MAVTINKVLAKSQKQVRKAALTSVALANSEVFGFLSPLETAPNPTQFLPGLTLKIV